MTRTVGTALVAAGVWVLTVVVLAVMSTGGRPAPAITVTPSTYGPPPEGWGR